VDDPISDFEDLLPTLERRTVLNARASFGDVYREAEADVWNAVVESVNSMSVDPVWRALALLDESARDHDALDAFATGCRQAAVRNTLVEVDELLSLLARMADATRTGELADGA
jgi:hypothetical protein